MRFHTLREVVSVNMGLLRSSNSDSIKIHPQKKNLAELNYVW